MVTKDSGDTSLRRTGLLMRVTVGLPLSQVGDWDPGRGLSREGEGSLS